MADEKTTVVRVRSARSPRRTAEVLRWLRWLAPAALLVVAPPPAEPGEGGDDVITIDADGAGSGPLSVADELVRQRRR